MRTPEQRLRSKLLRNKVFYRDESEQVQRLHSNLLRNKVFRPDMSEQVQKLRSKLSKYIPERFHGFRLEAAFDRNQGAQKIFEVVTIPFSQEKRGPKEQFDLVNEFLLLLGFSPFPTQDSMSKVDQQEARKILICVLTKSLAYPETILNNERAVHIAEQILSLFNAEVSYFTNAEFSGGPGGYSLKAFDPIAEPRTLDTGLILLDAQHIGLLWATEED